MSARTYWKTLLGALVTASVAGNVGHILLADVAHPIPAGAAAAFPPLLLAAVVEGLALTVGAALRVWVYRAGVAAAVVIAAGAFYASYIALRDLAVELGFPPAVAPVIPLLADAGMAMATLMVLALRPVAVQAGMVHAPAHAEPMHQVPVSAAEQAAPTGAGCGADAVTGDDAVAQAGAWVAQPDPQLHLVTGNADSAVNGAAVGCTGDAPAVTVHSAHLHRASELVEQGVTQLGVDRVAQVLALAEAGASAHAIARAVPANRRTVGKVLAAGVDGIGVG